MSRPFSSKFARKPFPLPSSSTATARATLKADRRKKKNEDQQQHHQQQKSLRSPLQDLNAIVTTNSTPDPSSSISIEAPRGCLRFFLSHSSSSAADSSKMAVHGPLTHSTTPKSAPLVGLGPSKPSVSKSKENRGKCNLFMKNSDKPAKPNSRKLRKDNPCCLYQWQSAKKPRSTTGQQSRNCSVSNLTGVSAKRLESGSVVKGAVELNPCVSDENFTPLNKVATGFGSDCRAEKAMEENSSNGNSKTKTPPIQASVSPEIQCGSSVLSTSTPACYGAGHVVSGVTDKRKCRPRGLLAVGENDSGFGKGKALGSFDYGDDDENVRGVFTESDATLIPLPTEASMHWLLSPCREDNESKKENAENGSRQSKSVAGSISLPSPFSPSCSYELTSDACNTASATYYSRKNVSMICPSGLPEFRELLEPLNHHSPMLSSPHSTHNFGTSSKEGRKHPYDLDGENSPFSMDSLGSGNVILTPGSDSSSDRYADLIRLSTDNQGKNKFDSELNSVVEALRKTSLSPNSLEPVRDSIDFSFQFDSLSTSCSSVYLTQFKQILDDQASWNSCSTLGNESQSQMRISWREGLMSQIYEMDEFDCCRCLSDEEEDTKDCSNDQLKSIEGSDVNATTSSHPKSDCWSSKILDDEPRIEEKGQENFPSGTPQLSYSCAESISTDGGGLLASADSDWDLCYKNELFRV
ncbi:GPI-anchored adhesin-like protein [Parasponia andersonii]|uniref:GPI-anchored adhesin-like protein n=1 Tax=Parasponia andersonii TaxID=3476 RepID=A0A2P5B4F6_PARAD|nr:GPI-anchored adhesin-like protein [Parasponia andersonii]